MYDILNIKDIKGFFFSSFPLKNKKKEGVVLQIKIFKSATKKSILDVRSGLNFYKTNKHNEEEYKGKIIFTINEYGQSKEQAQAYVSKATTKMALNLIVQHHFPRFFPNGFYSYGGTAATKRARVFFIKYDSTKKRYIFQIEEGTGTLTQTGAMKMSNKEKRVMTFLTYEDTLQLAHEVLDFISQAEMAAMFKGKPLYTIAPDFSKEQAK